MNFCKATAYTEWYKTRQGAIALELLQALLGWNIANWQGRSKSLLALNAGNGEFLETLCLAGFDLTAHEECQNRLRKIQKRMGTKIEYCLGNSSHLPFDDHSFDYAVVVLGLEFWKNPQQTIEELSRLVCGGCIFIFPNKLSLYALENLWSKTPLFPTQFLNPRKILDFAKKNLDVKQHSWSAILPCPSSFWLHPKMKILNSKIMPLPLGAFAALRVDFKPLCQGTPLFLRNLPATSGK